MPGTQSAERGDPISAGLFRCHHLLAKPILGDADALRALEVDSTDVIYGEPDPSLAVDVAEDEQAAYNLIERLLEKYERFLAGRRRRGTLAVALAALAIAIGSLVALFISESGSLFGFTEFGYRLPVVVAIVAEAATIALLGPVATVSLARVISRRREPTTRRRSARESRLDYGVAR